MEHKYCIVLYYRGLELEPTGEVVGREDKGKLVTVSGGVDERICENVGETFTRQRNGETKP